LAKGFQRRRLKCEKLTGDERQMMAKWAKNVKIVFAGVSAILRQQFDMQEGLKYPIIGVMIR
jgi:hypothetical protein